MILGTYLINIMKFMQTIISTKKMIMKKREKKEGNKLSSRLKKSRGEKNRMHATSVVCVTLFLKITFNCSKKIYRKIKIRKLICYQSQIFPAKKSRNSILILLQKQTIKIIQKTLQTQLVRVMKVTCQTL